MTSRQILNFLHSDEAKNAKITQVSFRNGEMVKVHFTPKDQIKELADDNIWMAMMADKSGAVVEFNGFDIKSLSFDTAGKTAIAPAKV